MIKIVEKPHRDKHYRNLPSFIYFIDEDKTGVINGKEYHGVVTAKLVNAKDFDNLLSHMYPSAKEVELFKRMARHVTGWNKVTHEFTATAYCSIEDEFDLEEGKRIARKKCWVKYYSSIATILNRCIDTFEDLFNLGLDMQEIIMDKKVSNEIHFE